MSLIKNELLQDAIHVGLVATGMVFGVFGLLWVLSVAGQYDYEIQKNIESANCKQNPNINYCKEG